MKRRVFSLLRGIFRHLFLIFGKERSRMQPERHKHDSERKLLRIPLRSKGQGAGGRFSCLGFGELIRFAADRGYAQLLSRCHVSMV